MRMVSPQESHHAVVPLVVLRHLRDQLVQLQAALANDLDPEMVGAFGS